jgi:hypothetical protein
MLENAQSIQPNKLKFFELNRTATGTFKPLTLKGSRSALSLLHYQEGVPGMSPGFGEFDGQKGDSKELPAPVRGEKTS